MHPRFLITLDEDLQPLPVNVRVGQAVDVVGQAGRPKTITGWQTQNTPVLLAYGERAELEDDEYISLSNNLEGLVILKKVSNNLACSLAIKTNANPHSVENRTPNGKEGTRRLNERAPLWSNSC